MMAFFHIPLALIDAKNASFHMHLKPADYVIRVFQGVCATARAIGRDPSSVSKWRCSREMGGCDGNIPGPARRLILSKAKELDLDITSEDLDYGRYLVTPE